MSSVKTVLASIRIGWYRDFGWTNPLTGLLMKTIAPIASVLSASIVYWLGSSAAGAFDPSHVSYILVGAALYTHVAAYSWVPSQAISEGKWSYVFPQVFISPKSSTPFLVGRCLASFVTSAMTSLISLAFAYYAAASIFKSSIPFIVTPLSMSLLLGALIANVPATLGLGILLAAYTIFASKFEWALPTYVAGLLMVFSEALFPVSVLPWPLSAFGNVLPFTQFIRAAREAVVYGSVSAYFYYVAYCLLGGLLFLAVSLWAYRWAERQGRKKGIIDRKVV